jgi:hypothetical protein
MRDRSREEIAGHCGRWYVGERCAGGCRVVALDDDGVQKLAARRRDPLWSFSFGGAATLEAERLIEAVGLAWEVRK